MKRRITIPSLALAAVLAAACGGAPVEQEPPAAAPAEEAAPEAALKLYIFECGAHPVRRRRALQHRER